jgi:hypothetical protein
VRGSPPLFFWTVIATTGERFSDFASYGASVNDAGTVAFQTALIRRAAEARSGHD